jgi:hypothetical protein
MKVTRFSEMARSIQAGWKPEWRGPAFDTMRQIMSRSLNTVIGLEASAHVWRNQGRLTSKGLQDEIRAYAKQHVLPDLKQSADELAAARADIATRRAQLAIPTPDPADTAGMALRGEMRTWLRSLPSGERLAALLSENADERLLQAALEVPPGMAGLTEQTRGEVQATIVERKYQAPLAEIEQMGEAANTAGAAIETSLYQLRREASFDENQPGVFDLWMEEASKSGEAAA